MQRGEELRRAMAAINEVDAKLDAIVKKREAECEMAVGYKPFCSCIMNELPVAWSFSDYVAITTKSKEENGYSKLNEEMRSAYEKVAPVRNYCVRAINAKP